MNFRWNKLLLWIGIPVLMGWAFFILSAQYLIDPTPYRDQIQTSLAKALNTEVFIGSVKVSGWTGWTMILENVRIKDRSRPFDLLQAERLILKIRLFPLLKRKVQLKRIVLDRPFFRLVRDKNGQLSSVSSFLINDGKGDEGARRKIVNFLSETSIAVRDGKILFSDEGMGSEPFRAGIRSLNIHFFKSTFTKTFSFRINGKLIQTRKEGRFSLNGTLKNISENMDLSKEKYRAEVKLSHIETSSFWPYLKTILPVKMLSGRLDLRGSYQGGFRGPFKASAKITLKEFYLDYPQVFAYIQQHKWLHLNIKTEYSGQELKIPRVFVEMPEIGVKAKGRIYGIGSPEMGMEAEAKTSPFDIADGKKLIPFRVINPDISNRLFQSEGKGSFQAVSVKLSGKMPEINQCDQLINAHTLSVEAKLNGAQLKLPWNLPPLEDLKGKLLFQKGNLHLKGVKGRIYHSPLEDISGTFYELLQVPTLRMACQGILDLKDLPSLSKTEGIPEEFGRALSSVHLLTGKAAYALSAEGVLTAPIHLRHRGNYRLSNLQFTHPSIPFPIQILEGQIELTQNDLKWSKVKMNLDRSFLRTAGSWDHGSVNRSFEMSAAGNMDMKNLFEMFQTPCFPEEVRSKTSDFEILSGTSLISFQGRRPPGSSRFIYEGEIFPKNISLRQKANPFPIMMRGKRIFFSQSGLELNEVIFESGASSLSLNGFIREGKTDLVTQGSLNLKELLPLMKSSCSPEQIRLQAKEINSLSGEAEIRLKWLGEAGSWMNGLKEGEIRLQGVAFQFQTIPALFSQIEGLFTISPDQIRFNELKGQVGNSPVSVSGAFSQIPPPSATRDLKFKKDLGFIKSKRYFSFKIFSPQLDLDPIIPKGEGASPVSLKPIREWLTAWSTDGQIQIKKAKYRSLHIQDLHGEIKTTEGSLVIDPFQFKEDGGDFWGEMRITPAEKEVRLEIKPRFSNMEAKAFLGTLFQKDNGEDIGVTGRVHIRRAEFKGEGEDTHKMMRSLRGGARVEIENGVIERFNILAKIFSVLNISQLFKGSLPDLTAKGLPFNSITATIQVKDGIAFTDDFLVDSNAMRITLLGKIDLSKNWMEATLGVHPLVTIDTIISHVPMVGYILTGEDKGFISYFYRISGNPNNPKIEPIPLKSIEEPSWGIIKRLLQTPLRSFKKAPWFNQKKEENRP